MTDFPMPPIPWMPVRVAAPFATTGWCRSISSASFTARSRSGRVSRCAGSDGTATSLPIGATGSESWRTRVSNSVAYAASLRKSRVSMNFSSEGIWSRSPIRRTGLIARPNSKAWFHSYAHHSEEIAAAGPRTRSSRSAAWIASRISCVNGSPREGMLLRSHHTSKPLWVRSS